MQSQRLARYRWKTLDLVQLAAIALAALTLVPVGAHIFAMADKLRLGPDAYLMVEGAHSGWTYFVTTGLLALAVVGLHAFLVRRNTVAFGWSMVAAAAIIAAQVVFWMVAYPVEVETVNWSALPANFDSARIQWEYALAGAGVLTFLSLLALVRAIEASRPFASISILESINRESAVRAARMRALSLDDDKLERRVGSA